MNMVKIGSLYGMGRTALQLGVGHQR
ncbi:MAG: hypothetical protein GY764_11005 [Halieaceae bacterium]|nr:hypothetical protein [Halieaceae bacterium]